MKAIATDNLVNRNRARIPAAELQALADYLIGVRVVADHVWLAGQVFGEITDAVVLSLEPPPRLSDTNQAIVAKEGYKAIQVEFDHQVDHANAAFLGDRSFVKNISIAFGYETPVCADCNCGFKGLLDPDCTKSFWDLEYYERHQISDAYEFSVVAVAAVKNAMLLKGENA